jgi:hypothetical protein
MDLFWFIIQVRLGLSIIHSKRREENVVSHGSYNPYENAQAQFDRVADMIGLDEATRALLRQPMKEYHFTIPVRMDDGSTRIFKGYRVQHNDARGPAKGGIRFHPRETADTIRALSMWMTWKCAVVSLTLMVNPDYKIPEMTSSIQEKVGALLEEVGGLRVAEVRIKVDDFAPKPAVR